MNQTSLRKLAWPAWALTLLVLAATLLLSRLNRLPALRYFDEFILANILGALGFATVGSLIVSRRAGSKIGWLMCVAGLGTGLETLIHQYVRYAWVTRPGTLPAPDWLAWLNFWLWVPIYTLIVFFLPLVFPDERLPSPRWRWAVWLFIAAGAAFSVTMATTSGAVDASLPEVMNPYVPPGGREPLPWLTPVTAVLLLAGMAAAIAAQVTRLRSASGVERLQVKWFAYSTAILVIAFLIPIAAYYPNFTSQTRLSGMLLAITFPLLPVAIGIAVLRYRLYNIDVIIRRTLVYTTLTGTLAFIYVASVVLLQSLLGALTKANNTLAIVASTLAIAALFNPLRLRVQRFIDTLFFRKKVDARLLLESFSRAARSEMDLERLTGLLLADINESMQPENLSLWMLKEQSRNKEV